MSSKVCDEINYPFPNFNGTIEVLEGQVILLNAL